MNASAGFKLFLEGLERDGAPEYYDDHASLHNVDTQHGVTQPSIPLPQSPEVTEGFPEGLQGVGVPDAANLHDVGARFVEWPTQGQEKLEKIREKNRRNQRACRERQRVLFSTSIPCCCMSPVHACHKPIVKLSGHSVFIASYSLKQRRQLASSMPSCVVVPFILSYSSE